jgi:site-specific DNA-cytosine methylase
MKLTFIEMFCGIGGFRLGLERSGWKCVWANDIDIRGAKDA